MSAVAVLCPGCSLPQKQPCPVLQPAVVSAQHALAAPTALPPAPHLLLPSGLGKCRSP